MAKLLAPALCQRSRSGELWYSCIDITLVDGLRAQTFSSRFFPRAAVAFGELEAQPKYVMAPCSGLAWPESSQSNNSSPSSKKAPSKQHQEAQLIWRREKSNFFVTRVPALINQLRNIWWCFNFSCLLMTKPQVNPGATLEDCYRARPPYFPCSC